MRVGPVLTSLCFIFFNWWLEPKIQIPLNGVSLAPADDDPTLNAGLVAFFSGNLGPVLLSILLLCEYSAGGGGGWRGSRPLSPPPDPRMCVILWFVSFIRRSAPFNYMYNVLKLTRLLCRCDLFHLKDSIKTGTTIENFVVYACRWTCYSTQ